LAKAIVIAAPQSGSGKTVLTLGLLRAFRRNGVKVAAAKVGPDYIDPGFHAAASGSAAFNLDSWAMPSQLIASLLSELARDTDLILIEGVMGLFDGPGSTADLAALLGVPVVLLVDCARMAQSIGALVNGFARHRSDVRIAGVILNRVASPKHETVLVESISQAVFGAVHRDLSLELPSRHLGLVQSSETGDLERFIETAADIVETATDLDALRAVAPEPKFPTGEGDAPSPLGQRITVARDEAFAFAYPHLLHSWRSAGAELTFFSPLADEQPSSGADAIYLPGGYPELHAARLSANGGFLDGLRKTAERGALIYGECGGYMVLGKSLEDAEGRHHAMAGLLPVETSFATRKLSLGYRELKPLAGAPWDASMRGHEFHYTTVASEGVSDRLFAARDAHGIDLGQIGLRVGRVMGSYAHIIA
jgi:cobyrinic acid a,c-diamide synthase